MATGDARGRVWRRPPTVRKWLPWYRIVWNLLWVIPVYVFRIGFVACIFLMRGSQEAIRAWEATG